MKLDGSVDVYVAEETTKEVHVHVVRKHKKNQQKSVKANDAPQPEVQVAQDQPQPEQEPAHTVLAHLNKEGTFIQGGEGVFF